MWRGISGLVLVAAMLTPACSATVTGPSPDPVGPLRVTVSQNPTFVGGMAVFSIRVDNISNSVLNLTFPSSCQVLPYFSDRAGRAVTPVGGGFACLTVITQQSLQPGAFFSQSFSVKPGTTPDAAFIVLPAGDYTIRGRLEDTVYKRESDPLAFALQ